MVESNQPAPSFLVRLWRDAPPRPMQVTVIDVERGREVQLGDNTFIVRVMVGQDGRLGRCYLRRVGGGEEAHVQGGAGLRAFAAACLAGDDDQQGQVIEVLSQAEAPGAANPPTDTQSGRIQLT
jgi:hypothetical protein